MTGECGASVRTCNPRRGGFGKTPGRYYDRPATVSLDWDRRVPVTPALSPHPRKSAWS